MDKIVLNYRSLINSDWVAQSLSENMCGTDKGSQAKTFDIGKNELMTQTAKNKIRHVRFRWLKWLFEMIRINQIWDFKSKLKQSHKLKSGKVNPGKIERLKSRRKHLKIRISYQSVFIHSHIISPIITYRHIWIFSFDECLPQKIKTTFHHSPQSLIWKERKILAQRGLSVGVPISRQPRKNSFNSKFFL